MVDLIGIERDAFYGMQADFDKFADEMKKMLSRGADIDKRLGNWVDSQYVLKTLQISERTLQTFRDNGTLAYSQIGHKMFYKPEDVEAIFQEVDDYKKNAYWRKHSKKNK